MSTEPNYYVYVLFDAFAVPRWVGKGRGNRMIESARPKKNNYGNRQKKTFIDRTIELLGEVPQLKIRENLTEPEAFEIEKLFIKVIGRGSATLGPEGCSERARKANEALTPAERTKRAEQLHANAAPETKRAWYAALNKNNTPEAQSRKSRNYWNSRTSEQRCEGATERAHKAWETRRRRYGKLGHP